MNTALAVGTILLAGLFGGYVAKKVKLPSVTGYLAAGILLGPSSLGLFDKVTLAELDPINHLALGVIALTIGAELQWSVVEKLGKSISRVFLAESSLTFCLILGALLLIGTPTNLALIFAALGIATAPGAIMACVRENPSDGSFCRVLLTTVALDNLLAIGVFGVVVSVQQIGSPAALGLGAFLWLLVRGLILAVLLGVAAGVALSSFTARIHNNSQILVAALGTVLVTVGVADFFEIPALLAAMTAGGFFANVSPAPQRLFRAVEPVEMPILVTFLTLAGVKLDFAVLPVVGVMGAVYILARFVGKTVGSRIGAHFTTMPTIWKRNIGLALTPQAGVAIGLSIIAEQKLPFPQGTITTLILGAVVVFEVIGPIFVKRALLAAQEDSVNS